jgi:hypothetical protein
MKMFLWQYTDIESRVKGKKGKTWIGALLSMAHAAERGPWLARQLQEWTHAYIIDREDLPLNVYGRQNVSLLEDEDLGQEIYLHLQGIGKGLFGSQLFSPALASASAFLNLVSIKADSHGFWDRVTLSHGD